MKINSIIETPDGAVELTAELSNEQVKFLVEVGLNMVLARNTNGFTLKGEHAQCDLHPQNETKQ